MTDKNNASQLKYDNLDQGNDNFDLQMKYKSN
jgi:hypothetical protein